MGIVFGGVGGHLWLIDRNGNSPTDLTTATHAPVATGHPSDHLLRGSNGLLDCSIVGERIRF